MKKIFRKTTSFLISMAIVVSSFLGALIIDNRVSAESSSNSLESLTSYDIIFGNSLLVSESNTGFNIGKDSAIIEKSTVLSDDEYVNCYSFDAIPSSNCDFDSYYNLCIITSYIDKDNYSYVRFYQMNGIQTYICYTVTNGDLKCKNDNIAYRSQSRIDLSKKFTVVVDKTNSDIGKLKLYQCLDDKIIKHNKEFKILPGAKTLAIISNLEGSSTIKVSNIKASPLSSSTYSSIAKERKIFQSKYYELLAMGTDEVTLNYQDLAKNAFSDYKNMNEYNKIVLTAEGLKVKIISDKISELLNNGAGPEDELKKGDSNYYLYNNDFTENIELINAMDESLDCNIVNDNGNSCLKMLKTNNLSAMRLKSYKMPEDVAIEKASYKLKLSNFENYTLLNIIISYQDMYNYEYISFSMSSERYLFKFVKVENGVELVKNNNLHNNIDSSEFNVLDWCPIDLVYTGKNVQMVAQFGKTTYSDTYSISFVPKCFAVANCSSNETYIDDISISYADYTDDMVADNDSIKIYYTGNTELYPNDTVLVSGNNIYENVSTIQIKELSNINSNSASYINATWYDSDTYEGKYIHSVKPDLSDTFWSNAVTVTPTQPTVNSVKFTIPSTFNKGMYAVRFNGFDFSSDEDDVVVYINRPRVSFVEGDEGKISTRNGRLKLVGDMLVYGYDKDNPDISKVKIQISGKGYNRILSYGEFTAENANSLQFIIPSDLSDGEYEVSVYNGTGNMSAWSIPKAFTVASSPRDSWPKTLFNVKTFGATGNKYDNATGAVVKALEAISLNGGGVLYFPEGQYNLCSEIYIPENVVLKGEGSGKSIVFWSEDMFPIDQLARAFVNIKRNVEFNSIGFYSSRVGTWFTSVEPDIKNIYFNDCYIYTNPYAQVVTNAQQGAWGAWRYSSIELTSMIMNEVANKILLNFQGGDLTENGAQNIQMVNTEIKTHLQANGHQRAWNYEGDYLYINGVKSNANWTTSLKGSCTIMENSSFENGAVSALAIGMYVYNTAFGPDMDNNRELWVADYPYAKNVTLKLRTDYNNQIPGTENCWYEVLNDNFTDDMMRYWQFKVVSGDGMNQVRYVTHNIGNIVCFNSPFATPITSSSNIIMREGRQDGYFVGNSLYNGGAGLGWYSGVVGLLMSENTYRKSGNYICSQGNDVIWYVTIDKADFNDPYMYGGYGYATGVNLMVTNDDGGYTSLHLSSGNNQPSAALFAFSVRRSNFSNGSYIDFAHNMGNDTARAILIEDNNFDGVSSPIIFWNSITLYDGALIRNNVFTNVKNIPKSSLEKTSYNVNRILVDDVKTTSEGNDLQMGDVNGDGKITLKDVSVIRFSLAELSSLSGNAYKRADVNNSGTVTLKDAAAIKYYVIYGVWDLTYQDIVDDNDGFFNGSW